MTAIPYGIDSKGNVVHIDDAVKTEQYICVECKQPLGVYNGEILSKHFKQYRTKKLCPLMTLKRASNKNKKSTSQEPADGIHQHFSDWITTTQKSKTRETKPQEESPPALEPDLQDEPIQITSFHFTERTNEPDPLTIIQHTVPIPAPDQMEWITKQAMLKPIKEGIVEHCPKTGLNTNVEIQCIACEHFREIRYPQRDMEKPPVVICHGHHQKPAFIIIEEENKENAYAYNQRTKTT